MNVSGTKKHCSEQELLEHIDGELPRGESAAVDRHLLACWHCRMVRARLEATIHDVASAADRSGHYSEDVVDARRQFLARARMFERERRQQSMWRGLPFRSFASVALACSAIVAVWVWRSAPLSALPVARPAHPQVEAALRHSPVALHQRFRVRFKPSQNSSDLDVWVDQTGKRTSVMWRQQPVERGGWLGHRDARAAILSAVTADAARMETAFVKWVGHSMEGPIDLGELFADFARRQGVRMRVEHGTGTALLIASQTARPRRLTAILEVDRATLQPRSLTLRCLDDIGGRELILTSTENTFHRQVPSLTLARINPRADHQIAVPEARAIERPAVAPATSATAEPYSSRLDSAIAEIEARYALHRLNATAYPTRISVESTGTVVIEVVVSSEERRAAILSALAELNRGRLISAKIHTVAELVEKASIQHSEDIPHTMVRTAEIPTQRAIEAYLAERGTDRQATRSQAIRYANDAVSRSQNAHADAYAFTELWSRSEELTRLALPPNTRWLLEAMLRDRVRRLRAYLDEERSERTPLLAIIAGPPVPQSPAPVHMMQLFAEIRNLSQFVFAGTLVPGERGAMRSPVSVQEAAGRLVALLNSPGLCCEEAEQRLAREFPIASGSQAESSLPDYK